MCVDNEGLISATSRALRVSEGTFLMACQAKPFPSSISLATISHSIQPRQGKASDQELLDPLHEMMPIIDMI